MTKSPLVIAAVCWMQIAPIAQAQGGYRELAVVPWLDRGIDLFAIDTDATVEHRFQREPGGDFASFEELGGVAEDIAALELADGRYEVFIVDGDQQLWHSFQAPGGTAWSSWELLDSETKRVSVARSASGRVELYVIGSDDAVWHRGRASDDAAFGDWYRLEFTGTQLAAAAADGDGFELIVIDLNYNTWHLSFDENAAFRSDPQGLAGESFDCALAPLPGGGHSLVAVGTDDSLWERRRTSGYADWSDWKNIPQTARRVALVPSSLGLELFTLDSADAVSRLLLTAADADWEAAANVVEASPRNSQLDGRARLVIPSLDVDKDVPINIGLRFSVDRTRVDITSFPTVVTEPFDTPFGETTSEISLPSSSTGELRRDDGLLSLPVTLHFDQSLNIPLIDEDGSLGVELRSDSPGGQLLDSTTGDVALVGSGRFDGDGATNPLDGQACTISVSGRLTPVP
jgi:hypothetical protein